MAFTQHHATIFLSGYPAAREIEQIRRVHDPVMAGQIDAHVTVVYPQEVPDATLLRSRIEAATARAQEFRLGLGGVQCFEDPDRGVYVEVHDIDGGVRRLRELTLQTPFQALDFPLHVTLTHPRAASSGQRLWAVAEGRRFDGSFTVREICITAHDGERWVTLDRFPLPAAPGAEGFFLPRGNS
jgi:2'-5' RNA ligase